MQNAIPRYKEVQNILRKQILKGTYASGHLLPSEHDLSHTYSITRTTVRQALDGLIREGLIAKHKGKGSIVISDRKSLALLHIKPFTSISAETSFKTSSVFLQKTKIITWPKPFFFHVNHDLSVTGCLHFERVRYVNMEPVILDNTYLPNVNLPRFTIRKFINDSLFETLQTAYGIHIVNVVQDLRAESATEGQANALKVNINTPLLHIYRKYLTNKKNFEFYSSLYCSTQKYTIGNQFSI
ncbi:MAG: GntR family transcriptional regulator [Cytophagales bacterium]|nr:GntR family transcriptional regulator [Cytophagales bacterium]